MGTHPIFESDFDCLTVSEMSKRRSNLAATEKISQMNQKVVRQAKKEILDSEIERGLYVLFAKDPMLQKGKEPFTRFSEMKKIKFKGQMANGFLDKELTQPLRKKDCYVGREVYYWLGYPERPNPDFPQEEEMRSVWRYRLGLIVRLVDADNPKHENGIQKIEVKEEGDVEINEEIMEDDEKLEDSETVK